MYKKYIVNHTELEVYTLAFENAMKIFQLTKQFPKEEQYSLTDQIRRSSRSVCANIAEAWRKRRYEGSFVHRLNDAEAEAAETQTWIQFSHQCRYIDLETMAMICREYDKIIGKIVIMINNPHPWILEGLH